MVVCVFMVSVEVTACVPEIAGGCVTEHVGRFTAPDGPPPMTHANTTFPVKPLPGVIVMFEVAEAPAATVAV